MKTQIILTLLVFCSLANAGVAATDLAKDFANPPASARPWVYYFIMDGNFTREGITADFEAMRRAGIGGMIIMEVNVGIPQGPVKFMSDEWRQLFKHAVREAERLGLQITLNAGPGWTGSGGPWVRPEQSMQHVVASSVEVSGPAKFDAQLPRPEPRPAYFGNDGLPEEILQAKKEFYVDVAVLAVPKTDDAQRIADIDEKALYLRHPYTSRPGTKPFLPAPASFATLPANAVIPADRVVDLTERLGADGRLAWEVPAGNWTLLRFGRTSTGANTRPAPAPGLGLECDKFDKAALDAHFEKFIGELLAEVGPRINSADAGWNALHIDSWEMGAQNWSGAFRNEFRKRRGYDPLRYLPVVTGRVVENLEVSERFLWDLRQTAQELVIANHAQHLKELGRRHGFGISIEPYDMNPCADLSLGAVADVPMCEFWLYGFESFFTVAEAASIAHTCGRPIVAAEAFTSSAAERWQAHPASMKALGDWAFCTGVNRLVFHRYQHQPWLDRRPGMTMGPYGVHWERTQTWWEMVPAYHAYLARCQFMLRRGLPVADVLFLAAEGAPHVFRAPPSATRGNPPDRLGYNFDGIAPETLLARVSVKEGKLVLPDGMSYRVLVLPERDTMTPALLRKVKELVQAGATVIGPPPKKSPSLQGYPECDGEVKALAREMWGELSVPVPASAGAASQPPTGGTTNPAGRIGKGRVVWQRGSQSDIPNQLANPLEQAKKTTPPESDQYGDFAVVSDVLKKMGVATDFESNAPLRYTHRRDGATDIYYVANPEDHAAKAECVFRVSGRQPELWDPVTGTTRVLGGSREQDGRTVVPLKFAPRQSWFVVFGNSSRPAPRDAGMTPLVSRSERTILGGPWEVSFDPQWGGPVKPMTFEKLEDWTKHPDRDIRYYSGTAIYRTTFDFPSPDTRHSSLFLDLGRVCVMASVRVNGRDSGVVWCAPWQVDITGAVKPGNNRLEITVANLWPNRLIGDQSLPLEKRVSWTTWNPFKQDTALIESGLLGPVTIRTSTDPDN